MMINSLSLWESIITTCLNSVSDAQCFFSKVFHLLDAKTTSSTWWGISAPLQNYSPRLWKQKQCSPLQHSIQRNANPVALAVVKANFTVAAIYHHKNLEDMSKSPMLSYCTVIIITPIPTQPLSCSKVLGPHVAIQSQRCTLSSAEKCKGVFVKTWDDIIMSFVSALYK